jgi:hypothetical protein
MRDMLKLLSLYVSRDTHHDEVDQAIANAFGAPSSSFSPDGQTYNFLEIEREGDVVTHLQTGRSMTVTALAALLREHCAFPRESGFEQHATGKLNSVEP